MQTCWDKPGPYACAPWTAALPAVFKSMHGYELAPYLAACFTGNDITSRRVRIHYRQTVATLFAKNFAGQIREWCHKRGVQSSGHFLLNEYLSMHVQGYGDMMQFVAEFDMPALDIPIPNPNQFQNFSYQQSRFFSSVTSWKKRETTLMLLDPIIGGYGLKRLAPDLPLLINSVNMASFHGVGVFSSYMTGHTQEDFRFLNEYTGRLTQVLRGARRSAGVALYYPIAMFQADLLPSNQRWPQIVDQNKKRQAVWDQTEKSLLNGDIEYMIVHPDAVEQAEIKSGRMTIGHGSYHTLVMPQLEFIPLAVAQQLKQFENSGGKILWVGQVPHNAEMAANDLAVKALMQKAQTTPLAKIAGTIDSSFSPQFDLTFTPGTDTLAVGRFYQKGKLIYLLVNRQQNDITVTTHRQRTKDGSAKIKILDPSNGKIHRVSLPAKLPIKANRSLLLVPDTKD